MALAMSWPEQCCSCAKILHNSMHLCITRQMHSMHLPITQQMNAPAQVFFNILHLNAEECLHIRINVSLRRDKYDFNVSSEKLHWGTILLSTVSKA